MQRTARKAVSPIIATLLLIAIAVAAGIIVYVYVNSLSGGLTGSGGQQVSDQLSMDAYNYGTISTGVVMTVRDTGSGAVTIDAIFFDGTPVTTVVSPGGTCSSPGTGTPFASCTTGQTYVFTIASPATGATSGTSHIIKLLTSTGGTSVISVVAGRTG
jgi:archaeal type IV pilus assembly protein PilA